MKYPQVEKLRAGRRGGREFPCGWEQASVSFPMARAADANVERGFQRACARRSLGSI